MVRHSRSARSAAQSADGQWDPAAAFRAGDRRSRSLCPRCGSDRAVDYGAQLGCGRCGASWQADADVVVEWRPPPGVDRSNPH